MNSTKILASQKPDVTVVVGSGDDAQEFQCYSVILAHASPVLDAMLSCEMREKQERRIEFPDKDPAAWAQLLECIDPAKASLYDHYKDEYSGYALILTMNRSNVKSLAPLFHELQMTPYLMKCDEILFGQKVYGKFRWSGSVDKDRKTRTNLIDLLEFTVKYGLQRSRHEVEILLTKLFNIYCWGVGDEEAFDMPTLEKVLEITRSDQPNVDEQQPAKKQCIVSKSGSFWDIVTSLVDLSLIPNLMTKKNDTFLHLVYYSLKRQHKVMQAKLEEALTTLRGKEGYLRVFEQDSREVASIQAGENITMTHLSIAVFAVISARSDHSSTGGDRSFRFDDEKNRLHLESKASVQAPKIELLQDYSDFLPRREVGMRSSEMDLVVSVDCGGKHEEFRCHSSVLAYASAVLDSAIASCDGTLNLHDLDPDGWEPFYQCIDPYHNGSTLYDYWENADVAKLVRWFSRFGMKGYLRHCEFLLCRDLQIWTDNIYEGGFKDALYSLQLAVDHGFEYTKQKAEDVISDWLSDDEFYEEYFDHFDLGSVQAILSFCLPIQRSTPNNPFTSTKYPKMWDGLSNRIASRLSSVNFNKVDESECVIFANLVYHFYQTERATHLSR